jgi:hypothetical protein
MIAAAAKHSTTALLLILALVLTAILASLQRIRLEARLAFSATVTSLNASKMTVLSATEATYQLRNATPALLTLIVTLAQLIRPTPAIGASPSKAMRASLALAVLAGQCRAPFRPQPPPILCRLFLLLPIPIRPPPHRKLRRFPNPQQSSLSLPLQ